MYDVKNLDDLISDLVVYRIYKYVYLRKKLKLTYL